MCGIAGFIGKSKRIDVSNEIMTNVFEQLESRGTDASGVWGGTEDGQILYDKAPVKSSLYIKGSFWNKVQKLQPDILLVHARKTSPGIGHARHNINNHPFVSEDCRIGLIHNGRVNESTYLKEKYEVQSDCDSEVLLRMYEAGLDKRIKIANDKDVPACAMDRMAGLHDIWANVKDGSMAVAIGEVHENAPKTAYPKTMFLFRNDKRPLWVADLRKTLGQVFFFSSIEIWHTALAKCKKIKKELRDIQKLSEIPTEELWFFKIDQDNPTVTDTNFIRFSVERKDSDIEWEPGDFQGIQAPKRNTSIITNIAWDDKKQESTAKSLEELSVKTNVGGKYRYDGTWAEDWEDMLADHEYDNYMGYDLKNCSDTCDKDDEKTWKDKPEERYFPDFAGMDHDVREIVKGIEEKAHIIRRLLDDIETSAINLLHEGSLTADDARSIYESLEQNEFDLDGTYRILPGTYT